MTAQDTTLGRLRVQLKKCLACVSISLGHVPVSCLELPTNKRLFLSLTLMAVVRRLHSIPHIVHLTVLQLPSLTLQNPYIVAPIEDTERFADVMESVLLPTRAGDAVAADQQKRRRKEWKKIVALTMCSPSLSLV